MQRIDALHLERPFLGSRRIADALVEEDGLAISRKRIQRLMRTMGITAPYPKPRLSQPAPGHRIYPYGLRGLTIDRPNQVWAKQDYLSSDGPRLFISRHRHGLVLAQGLGLAGLEYP